MQRQFADKKILDGNQVPEPTMIQIPGFFSLFVTNYVLHLQISTPWRKPRFVFMTRDTQRRRKKRPSNRDPVLLFVFSLTRLQPTTTTTTLATGAVGGRRSNVLDAPNAHTSTGKSTESWLSTRARGLSSVTYNQPIHRQQNPPRIIF